jgi:hypothetical protein
MPRKKVTVYTVREVQWEYNDEYYYRQELPHDLDDVDTEEFALAFFPPVKAFLSPDKAEAHRAELERRKRDGVNPFSFAGYGDSLEEYTTASGRQFRERVEELGLDFAPLDIDRRGRVVGHNLVQWWEENVDGMTPEQRDGVWELLDGVRYYEVVPMKVELEE